MVVPTGLGLSLDLDEHVTWAAGGVAAPHCPLSSPCFFSALTRTVSRLSTAGGGRSTRSFSSVSSRKRSSWWSCCCCCCCCSCCCCCCSCCCCCCCCLAFPMAGGSTRPALGLLAGGSFLISGSLVPSAGLLSWSRRCRILWRSVSVLWDAGHWPEDVERVWGAGEVSCSVVPPVPSRSWLSLGLALLGSSLWPNSGNLDRGGRAGELPGVGVCLASGEGREKGIPSPPDCCRASVPAGE